MLPSWLTWSLGHSSPPTTVPVLAYRLSRRVGQQWWLILSTMYARRTHFIYWVPGLWPCSESTACWGCGVSSQDTWHLSWRCYLFIATCSVTLLLFPGGQQPIPIMLELLSQQVLSLLEYVLEFCRSPLCLQVLLPDILWYFSGSKLHGCNSKQTLKKCRMNGCK